MTAAAPGRQYFQERRWADAFEALSRADETAPLEADDLERLALAAALTAHDADMLRALERLYQLRLDAGELPKAVYASFWLGFRLMSLGEMGRAAGWIGRCRRLVEQQATDCVECGYAQLLTAVTLMPTDIDAARKAAGEAAAIGARFGDADLCALSRMLLGRLLRRDIEVPALLSLLDESMVATATGELSPLVAGLVYCSAIATCHQVYALDRAREWTSALSDFCTEQPQLMTFAGRCLVHRSEVMQFGGAWQDAIDEARRAAEHMTRMNQRDGAADALYQEAEIHRLRGEHDEAERAYRAASELGREPQPGLSLLRLAQGQAEAAAAALRRLLSVTGDPLERAHILPAFVEVMLAQGDVEEARRAAEELATRADELDIEVLGAIALHAQGAVAFALGDARGALQPLRRAFRSWQQFDAPYLAARVRVVIGRVDRALGDEDGARLEFQAARKVFVELGARPSIDAVDALLQRAGDDATGPTHGLTPRELQVLRLVAAGKTNKEIAGELFVSEKTVDRHVSNIFGKIEVSTRAAATAFAYEQGLV